MKRWSMAFTIPPEVQNKLWAMLLIFLGGLMSFALMKLGQAPIQVDPVVIQVDPATSAVMRVEKPVGVSVSP